MNLRLIITLLCVLMTKIQPEVAQKITWEDLRMIAAQDEEMTIASKALYKKIRINMLAYGLRHMRTSLQRNVCWSIV